MSSPLPTFFRPVENTFKFQIVTTAPNQTFTLPINGGGPDYVQNFTVNWGDNSSSAITSYDDADRIHTYVDAGTYDIELNGKCEWFAFNYEEDCTKVKKLLSFTGDIGLKVLNFSGCTNLSEIVSLGNFSLLTTAFFMFGGCTSLTSIPSGLFDGCKEILSFSNAFNGCNKITSIPTDLFKYNTLVTNFNSAFNGCNKITSIPSGLFDNNTLVTNFSYAFYSCNKITSIPTDLFRYNTLVTDFSGAFAGCNKITSIPTDLFKYNTLVTNFSYTFVYCSSLTSIPSGLFDNNTLVTDFSYIFYYCILLDGNAPELWLRDPEPTGIGCFQDCTGLDNYADIPANWK